MDFNINKEFVSILGTAFPGLKNTQAFKDADKKNNPLRHDKSQGSEFGSIGTYQTEKQYALSSLGTPLFFPMKIDGVQLPNAPLITVSAMKHVVKTPVAGRDFTVKEIVSLDDYKINLKGIATNYDAINGVAKNKEGLVYEDYPEDWLILLNNLYRRKRSEKANDTISLPVECELLRMLGIHYVVIEKISFPAMAGVQSALAYEMELVSDEHIELQLSEKQ